VEARPGPTPADLRQRALWVALVANAAFAAVEVVGGVAFGSLALVADATHMVTDVAALAIALAALRLSSRPATARHSFGLQRAEVLGAQANGLFLLAASGWIVYAALGRLGDPPEVGGAGVALVAAAGLVVNVGSALGLARARGASLNMRGAFAHMVADAAGSVAALAAGLAVLAWGATWVDPVASLAIGALVVASAARLLRDTTHVLLEGAPPGTDPAAVETALSTAAGVDEVHHLHLWNLASDVPSLSAHVVLAGELSLHEAQERVAGLKALLDERFGIGHATIELECHGCEVPEGMERCG